MALNCLVSTIKCNTVFTFYAPTRPIMENVNESHDKPPTTNVETSSPSLQTELDPSKKKNTSCESVKSMVALYKSGTN
jgi:hypothetical protein